MHIIVIGAGEVGSHVAELLSAEGNDVAVVEQDAARVREVEQRLDVLAVCGSGTHPATLRSAGLDRAELLVAVSSDDEANLIACLLAKQAGVRRAIARIEAPALRGKEAAELHAAMGADLIIDPDEEVASEVMDLLDYPGASEIAVLGGGEVIVIGARLGPDAPLVGRTLGGIAAEYEPEWEFMVGAITRGEDTIIPRRNHRLEANDLVRMVVKRRARRDVLGLLGLDAARPHRVMILGGGRTGQILAGRLADRHARVSVVERDPVRAREIAEALEGVLVIEGDIGDAELLASEDVGGQDAVVAVTGEDDANILACLFAKSMGTTETIAVLHRLSLRGLLNEVGIDVALSPRTASANGVLRFVRGGVAQVATFLDMDVEVLELSVMDGSPGDGAVVSELGLPKEVLIGAIVRDGKAQIARGHSELRSRDHLVVFARPQTVAAVQRLFA
ncbi:MAG: Trk system potassium transporter TrkA [Acidimicrobiales bacterium]